VDHKVRLDLVVTQVHKGRLGSLVILQHLGLADTAGSQVNPGSQVIQPILGSQVSLGSAVTAQHLVFPDIADSQELDILAFLDIAVAEQ